MSPGLEKHSNLPTTFLLSAKAANIPGTKMKKLKSLFKRKANRIKIY